MTERAVVGIEKVGEDWLDAYGHYWAWDAESGHWDHDRRRCQLAADRPCEKAS